jgi:hypothetical protein
MKSTVLLAATAFALLFSAGCRTEPVSVSASSNPLVEVALLFEHDGVRVYRFYDEGRPRYYAVPRSASWASVSDAQSCGKNCVVGNETVTVAR